MVKSVNCFPVLRLASLLLRGSGTLVAAANDARMDRHGVESENDGIRQENKPAQWTRLKRKTKLMGAKGGCVFSSLYRGLAS